MKKQTLKHWIYDNGDTIAFVAGKLGITAEDFKRMLSEHEKFSPLQIKQLIYLTGAKSAFQVIYFPTYKERLRIEKEAFGREEDEM